MLFPEPRRLAIAGEALEIRPLTIGQLGAFARALEPVLPALAALDGPDLVGLMRDHSEALIDAAAIAVQRDRTWVEELDLAQFVELAAVVLEINADFFARRAMPALTAAMERIAAAAGPTRSNGSSATATG